MSSATLSNTPSTQLTFPWAMPKAEREPHIVPDRSALDRSALDRSAVADSRSVRDGKSLAAVALEAPVAAAASLQEAMVGDRIGKPFRVGAVMFRLLKKYGISDEEIAEGIASYTAKQAGYR